MKDIEIDELQMQVESLTNAYNDLLEIHNALIDGINNKRTLHLIQKMIDLDLDDQVKNGLVLAYNAIMNGDK